MLTYVFNTEYGTILYFLIIILNTILSNYWCRSFVKMHSFRVVSDDPPETMRNLCLSAKFSHEEIRWNYNIFRRVYFPIIIIISHHLYLHII